MDKEKLLARAKELQKAQGFGNVFLIDDFIEEIKNGCFINYDGIGVFGNWNGAIEVKDFFTSVINCDVKWLEENRKDYLFIFWYNK
jgi:hypothetical protein